MKCPITQMAEDAKREHVLFNWCREIRNDFEKTAVPILIANPTVLVITKRMIQDKFAFLGVSDAERAAALSAKADGG